MSWLWNLVGIFDKFGVENAGGIGSDSWIATYPAPEDLVMTYGEKCGIIARSSMMIYHTKYFYCLNVLHEHFLPRSRPIRSALLRTFWFNRYFFALLQCGKDAEKTTCRRLEEMWKVGRNLLVSCAWGSVVICPKMEFSIDKSRLLDMRKS